MPSNPFIAYAYVLDEVVTSVWQPRGDLNGVQSTLDPPRPPFGVNDLSGSLFYFDTLGE